MQKFTANSLIIHDITQDPVTLGYAIHPGVAGLDFPELRIVKHDKPAEHGSIVSAQLYGGRQVDLTGFVTGNSTFNYYQNRRALEAACRIVKNNYVSQTFLNKLTTDDGLALQFLAYCTKFKCDIETRRKADFLLTLFAPDPNLYSQTLRSSTLGLTTGTVTNNGNVNTWPILTFNGPLTNPILTNTDLTESFKLNVTLASGHSVVVDTLNKTIILDGTTNANAYFDLTNTWLSWIPGINHLTLSASAGTGNVGITFRDAYAGS
jgi:phage-related protein